MVWVDLQEIEWGSVPGILMLKPQDIDLVGNVLCEFTTLDGEDSTLDGCAETSPNLTDGVSVERQEVIYVFFCISIGILTLHGVSISHIEHTGSLLL